MNPWRTVGRDKRRGHGDGLGRDAMRRWWRRLRRGKSKEAVERIAGESEKDDLYDWDEKTRVRRRTA
jgi:hypothetical protein